MRRIPIPLFIAPILALVVFATCVLTAQLPFDPDLVYVRVAFVEPERNHPVRGLLKENLKLFEDGKPQDIVYFSDDSRPLQMEIIWDNIGDPKDNTRATTLASLTKSGDRNDEFHLTEQGKTPLNEAVLQSLNALAQNGNSKKSVLVLITWRSSLSAYPLAKVRDRLKELNVPFYVVSQQMSNDVSSDIDREALRELAELSGGSAFFPRSPSESADISRKIVTVQKNQYLLGYRSTNKATDGKWRKIKITGEHRDSKTKKLVKFNVFAKSGYYAPAANAVRSADLH